MSEESRKMIIERDVMVPMRDGVRLATDIYRPDSRGTLPAIVFRTPYDKSARPRGRESINDISIMLAEQGYVAVTQDIRGWHASEGNKNEKDETEDGYDTVEWVAKLPYCNGKIGMWGYSYPCITALAAAEAQPPHLVCLFVGGIPSLRTDDPNLGATGNPTDIFEPGRRFLWVYDQGAEDRKRQKEGWKTGPTTREEADRVFYDIDRYKWIWFVPLTEIPDEVFGGLKWMWLDYVKAGYKGILRDKGGDPHRFKVPICWPQGWFDRLNGDFYLYDMTVKHGATGDARLNQRLIVGPWGHTLPWNFHGKFGDVDFGPESILGSPWDVMGPWFDYWLKGIDRGLSKEPPVKIFVIGENRWRYENEWPLGRTVTTDYYIHSLGNANTAYGDGTLDTSPPGDEPPDTYTYDSRDPVMSIDLKVEQEAPFDLRPNDHRKDILFYYSEPIKNDLEVTGMPGTKFWASSSARDTDFMVRICDVFPDGFVLWLSNGIVRASRFVEDRTYRNPRPIEPGKNYEYSFNMRSMCNIFKAGHRIRVDITSSHFPKFDRNHNTGKIEYWEDAELLKATQTIYHDKERPFKVSLPIIPR